MACFVIGLLLRPSETSRPIVILLRVKRAVNSETSKVLPRLCRQPPSLERRHMRVSPYQSLRGAVALNSAGLPVWVNYVPGVVRCVPDV